MQGDLFHEGKRTPVRKCSHGVEFHVPMLPPKASGDGEYEIFRCTVCKQFNEWPWREAPGDAYEVEVIPEVFEEAKPILFTESEEQTAQEKLRAHLHRRYTSENIVENPRAVITLEEAAEWFSTGIIPESARIKIRASITTEQSEPESPQLTAEEKFIGKEDEPPIEPKKQAPKPEEYKHPALDPNRSYNDLPF
jgi:hypothetical protein